MIIFPHTPGGSALFCDDIREEVAGKTSLIGIYSGDMLLQATLPVMLPQICCFINAIFDPENLPNQILLQVQKHKASGEMEVMSSAELPSFRNIEFPEPIPSDGESKPLIAANGAMKISPLLVDEEFTLRAVAIVDGDEYRLGRLSIRLVEKIPLRQ